MAGSHSVSATVALLMPASVTMSPASATSMPVEVSPRKASTLDTRNRSSTSPSRLSALAVSPARTVPDSTRPVRMRPMNGSAESVVASIRNGWPLLAAWRGSGTWRTMRSKSASRFSLGPSSSMSAQPERPEA